MTSIRNGPLTHVPSWIAARVAHSGAVCVVVVVVRPLNDRFTSRAMAPREDTETARIGTRVEWQTARRCRQSMICADFIGIEI